MHRSFARLAAFALAMLGTAALAMSAAAALASCSAARPLAQPRTSSQARPTLPSTSAPAVSPSSPASPASSVSPSGQHHRRHRHAHRHHAPATSSSTPAASPTTAPARGDHPLTVVLNPGHNGGNAAHPDEINRQVPAGYGTEKACDTTGTETDAGYPEHSFNWDVSLRVARILRAHGLRVVFTRHSDTGVGPCVDRRAYIGNHPWDAAVVSIHADGAPSSGHGFHVNQDSRIPDGATRRVARESRELGRYVHDALVRSSGLVPSTYIGSDGYYYRTDLAGLDLATRPATFLELGNMKNAGDASLQSSASGRQRIAAAVAEGILGYLRATGGR